MSPWEKFVRERSIEIFSTSTEVIDIGGSLRVDGSRANRVSPKNAWALPYLEKISYKVLDMVPDYHPDIVGDIHALPFNDGSQEAILCIAVMEHVRNPFKAMEELHRVLKPGGKLLIYFPFLYYYHAHVGYYKDYWRYTYDGVEELMAPFANVQMCEVRGRFETLLHLTPFGKYNFLVRIARYGDRCFQKKQGRQVSGYFVYATKK